MQTKNGEWWDYSWNVAPGCTKVSDECTFCWALAMAKRLQAMKKPGYEGLVDQYGRWTEKVNLIGTRVRDPLGLKKPRVIAVNLMGDLFHPEISDAFIRVIFERMRQADWHTYMVLTKRPERMKKIIQGWRSTESSLPHVWLGTTAGKQRTANERWSAMAWLAQQGWNTWVSSEPRLEAINWHGWEFLKRMITGGESGPYARPMSPAWPRADRDWCQAHKVAFWHKQNGEWAPAEAVNLKGIDLSNYPMTTIGEEMIFQFGRKMAGRVLDGRTWEEEVRL